MEDKKLYQIKNKNNMKTKKINYILRKYKKLFDILENYDRTRELPFHRKRVDVTLSNTTIKTLRDIKEKTGKSMSEIIEESIGKCVN